jgi:hypothetical protein
MLIVIEKCKKKIKKKIEISLSHYSAHGIAFPNKPTLGMFWSHNIFYENVVQMSWHATRSIRFKEGWGQIRDFWGKKKKKRFSTDTLCFGQ